MNKKTDLTGTSKGYKIFSVIILVAMVLFSGVRRRVEQAVTPVCFKGLPITLVAAAITSVSFMGFGGLVENIISALL